jgi:hypothetical protein
LPAYSSFMAKFLSVSHYFFLERSCREQDTVRLDLEHVSWIEKISWVWNLVLSAHGPTTFKRNSDLFPIDLNLTMNNELPRLPHTASKQCSENGRVESSLNRCIGHMHIWDLILAESYLIQFHGLLSTGASSCSQFRSIVLCQISVIHGND